MEDLLFHSPSLIAMSWILPFTLIHWQTYVQDRIAASCWMKKEQPQFQMPLPNWHQWLISLLTEFLPCFKSNGQIGNCMILSCSLPCADFQFCYQNTIFDHRWSDDLGKIILFKWNKNGFLFDLEMSQQTFNYRSS